SCTLVCLVRCVSHQQCLAALCVYFFISLELSVCVCVCVCVGCSHYCVCLQVRPVMPKCAVPVAVPVGKPAEFRCSEEEGFPRPKLQLFRNSEETLIDSKTSPRFTNACYS